MVKKKSSKIVESKGASYLGPYTFANSLGLTSVFFILIYAVTVWFGIYNGDLFAELYPIPFDFSSWSIIIGLAQSYVFSYVFGYIFVKLYNKSLKTN